MSDNNMGPDEPLQRIITLMESRRGSLVVGLLMAVTFVGGAVLVVKDLL